MNALGLIGRGLAHYRLAHLALGLAAMVGCAVLTGALIVGDSLRGSLRAGALRGLSGVDHAIEAGRPFRAELAAEIADTPKFGDWFERHTAVLALLGSATTAESRQSANRVQFWGVDESFREATGIDTSAIAEDARSVAVNAALAGELGAKIGDELIVRCAKWQDVPAEATLGRRDEPPASMRVTIRAITDDALSLTPSPGTPLNLYLPRETLGQMVGLRGRANRVLLSSSDQRVKVRRADLLDLRLRVAWTLDDLGLRCRVDGQRGYLSLESRSMILEPLFEKAGRGAAAAIGAGTSSVLAQLANEITLESGDGSLARSIPYSIVAGWNPIEVEGMSVCPAYLPQSFSKPIVLSAWAARDLGAMPGDNVTLSYYVSGEDGQLATERVTLRVTVIAEEEAAYLDPGFVPEYPGLTDTRSMADWDPPFPVDLKKVRPVDEEYWDAHRTTPKAFVSLKTAQELWARDGDRFGRITSLRVKLKPVSEDHVLTPLQRAFEKELLTRIPTAQAGIQIRSLRDEALAAGAGSTDFGGLFIGFSLFLIVSAALLSALVLRQNIERRAREIGLLRGLGFRPRAILSLLAGEAMLACVMGCVAGLPLAAGYAWLMLAGLRGQWSAAIPGPPLELHATAGTLGLGLAISVAVAWVTLRLALRGLGRQRPLALLAGQAAVQESNPSDGGQRSRRINAVLTGAAATSCGGLMIAGMLRPASAGLFFGAGALALMALLLSLRGWLLKSARSAVATAPSRLEARNLRRNPGRSLSTATLIACAVFLIASIGVFRLDPPAEDGDRRSGLGGYSLMATSALPILADINTAAGRETMNIRPEPADALLGVRIDSLRAKDGDATSCLNPYRRGQPRIVAASDDFIERSAFEFGASMATDDATRANPWLLLKQPQPDGAIPAIGDEAAVLWQLHSALGKSYEVMDAGGRIAPLRFVALLRGSVLQDEVMVADAAFVQLFPRNTGRSYFLIETPPGRAEAVAAALERDLSPMGFDARSTRAQLAAFQSVQNTYLGTFQTLGGLGLVLGSVGTIVLMLRNVWERRRELALLRSMGFTRARIAGLVVRENVLLVLLGVGIGLCAATLAVVPQAVSRGIGLPWREVGVALASVIVVAWLGARVALRPLLRQPIPAALRVE